MMQENRVIPAKQSAAMREPGSKQTHLAEVVS
jgi:hypothetical protein